MLKDIIEEKSNEIALRYLELIVVKKTTNPVTHDWVKQEVAETAQIVAREVLRKVREGVPKEIPSMPDLCIDSHEGWLRSKNTLLDHLQSLEESLLDKN
jgi:hypothetical protein